MYLPVKQDAASPMEMLVNKEQSPGDKLPSGDFLLTNLLEKCGVYGMELEIGCP